MPFTGEILNYRSVAVVGTEKNTGKTECLNYIIRRLRPNNIRMAVTSIGVDGESCDQLTGTPKPEIEIYEPMMFVTSETHYRQHRFLAEILNVSSGRSTSLGRLVTARALEPGKVLLSGPSDAASLTSVLDELRSYGAQLTLVDGALSRKSLGSPSVTDAMILATGAAWSANLPTLVQKTKFLCNLIALPETSPWIKKVLHKRENLCSIDESKQVTDLGISSVLGIWQSGTNLFKHGHTLYVPGLVTDRLLKHLKSQTGDKKIRLIVKDFTRIFASQEVVQQFLRNEGTIEVLLGTKLIAICINPTAPDGTVLNSDQLRDELSEKTGLPVWDIRKLAV